MTYCNTSNEEINTTVDKNKADKDDHEAINMTANAIGDREV